ncbi:MAG: hypothetical protein KDE15_10055 [Erythrobacter sp.]|nr:hypothetical protein [Erythrobacter sp.]
MHWPDFITFASNATQFGLWGAGFLLLSVGAAVGDYRRLRRSDIDKVGLMPWRDIGALSGFVAIVLLAIAAIGWIRG